MLKTFPSSNQSYSPPKTSLIHILHTGIDMQATAAELRGPLLGSQDQPRLELFCRPAATLPRFCPLLRTTLLSPSFRTVWVNWLIWARFDPAAVHDYPVPSLPLLLQYPWWPFLTMLLLLKHSPSCLLSRSLLALSSSLWVCCFGGMEVEKPVGVLVLKVLGVMAISYSSFTLFSLGVPHKTWK